MKAKAFWQILSCLSVSRFGRFGYSAPLFVFVSPPFRLPLPQLASISLNLASDLRVSDGEEACTITGENTNETAAFLQPFIGSSVRSEIEGLGFCHPSTAVHSVGLILSSLL